MSGVTIGRAEAAELVVLRARVLGRPDSRPRMHLQRDLADDTRHWAAYLGDRVVGCVSVMALRGWALRGMAVAPEVRRRGIGAALLERVTNEVGAPLWCNARLDAVAFYEACGWRVCSPVFVIDGAGCHRRMIWDPTAPDPA